METDNREFKHICKFCGKGFACGRSLGGHMRSHMITDILAQADGTKLTRKKLPSLMESTKNNSNGDGNNSFTRIETSGYGLRENPKKNKRLEVHSSIEDTSLVVDKFCKECGKAFQSWKALFGHMKRHSQEKERGSTNNNSLEEEQDSWTSANNNNQKQQVLDSQSDNEAAAPNRGKRSERQKRYMGTANSSSLSFANNNNASSSLSETEQEQEEVALCLMMLSRDVGGWNSVAESSDNNSAFLGSSGTEVKILVSGKKLETEDLRIEGVKKTDYSVSGINIPRKSCFQTDKRNKSPINDNCGSVEFGKRKFPDSELKTDYLKKLETDDLGLENFKNSDKSSKFECKTCNKIFHSYQALGGHRASHKKIKGCFASRIDSSENSIENEVSPDQTADSKLHKSINNEILINGSITHCENKAEKSKGHECPICFKVFSSGQALGGHKRAHLVGGNSSEAKITNEEEPVPAIRDFLDLNLPAPVEEESNEVVGFNHPWWIGSSNHKHEAVVGLISN